MIHSELSTDISLNSRTHKPQSYELNNQIGYLLRLANQRHLEIFSEHMPSLTPTQFSVLARLQEVGELSQNELGRQVGIDAATTKGVIERLVRKNLIKSKADIKDRRRLRISLTALGISTIEEAILKAQTITRATVVNLTLVETARLLVLLKKLNNTWHYLTPNNVAGERTS